MTEMNRINGQNSFIKFIDGRPYEVTLGFADKGASFGNRMDSMLRKVILERRMSSPSGTQKSNA